MDGDCFSCEACVALEDDEYACSEVYDCAVLFDDVHLYVHCNHFLCVLCFCLTLIISIWCVCSVNRVGWFSLFVHCC